jgi:hypothetical protein
MKKRKKLRSTQNDLQSKVDGKQPLQKARPTEKTILFGPTNDAERRKLADKREKEELFFRKRFADLGQTTSVLGACVLRSFIRLGLMSDCYWDAIMNQGTTESNSLLERIVLDVREQIAKGEHVPPPRRTTVNKPGKAKSCTYGSYPNDCCQRCGRYLQTVCYSEKETKGRVPRTNKICSHCFGKLPEKLKVTFTKYTYKRGHEPKGTGWNPNKDR